MSSFLSLCMIVKNEEKVLERCLDSVKDIVDEIIIVDTGSNDNTKKIAAKYTDKVFDFRWTDSFSDARNFAQTKATGKWILVLNADEFVERENLIKVKTELLENSSPKDAFSCKIFNFTGDYGEQIIQHNSIRIYKNNNEIKFVRTIHEQLKKNDGELIVGNSNLVIYHSGYLMETIHERNNNKRNVALIRKQIQKQGDNGFDYFNMGNEYLSTGQVELALEAYKKAYQKKKSIFYKWVPYCVVQIVLCLIKLKRYTEALKVIEDAQNIWKEAPDFKDLKGYVYLLQNRLEDAKYELEELVNNKNKYHSIIKSIDYLEYHPFILLGEIYENKGEVQEAINNYSIALKYNNKSLISLKALMKIALKYVDHNEIYDFIKLMGVVKNKEDIKKLIKVIINIPGSLSLIEKYLNEIEGIQEEQQNKGIQIKINLIKNEYYEAFKRLSTLSINDLKKVLFEGIFDFIDLLILCLALNQKKFAITLNEILDGKKDIINFLFDVEFQSVPEYSTYLLLLERCICLNQFDLFEKLIAKRNIFDNKINLYIGHLLYKYGFNELAISFYQTVEVKNYDNDIYINLINFYKNKHNYEAAWEWILIGISQGVKDYRLFELAFCLYLNSEENSSWDINQIINIAFQEYSDSKHLNYLLNSIREIISKRNKIKEHPSFYVGFFLETTFHYYVYESIINELVNRGVKCHLVINDSYEKNPETEYMYNDLVNFINKLERSDIEAYTVSIIRQYNFKYDCLVSCYYSSELNGLAKKHVRTPYGLLSKEFWNYAWWNVFYDKILCYSEYDYSRLNIYNNCTIVGNPKFDKWFRNDIENLNEVKQKFYLEAGKPTILYAPTYGKLSSIDDWIEEINKLQNSYNVVIKLHHGTALRESEKNRRKYINENFKNVTSDQNDNFALLKLSDYVLTDNSGMIFEAMLANKKILLLNPEFKLPIEENSGEKLIRDTIVGLNKGSNIEDYLRDTRLFEEQEKSIKKVINKIYTLNDGCSGERAAKEIIKLLENDGAEKSPFLLSLRQVIFG